ncbi:MAG: FecR domain-containing protein [Treponema sp.]|nr:FecR domain-containing protein [Treponema sp.]
MKKLILIPVLFFTASFIFAQNPQAVIRELTGTVEIKQGSSADWVPARVGDVIERSAVVSTSFRSMAVLAVGSSTLTVRPLTRLSLDELISVNETETININLNTGRIRADVSPPAGGRTNFTVQSPSATASVRGTSFEMDTVSIQVITGAVSFVPSGSVSARPVTVSAGQETWVNTDTGGVVSTMAAAEVTHSLPPLPGQSAGTIPEVGSHPETTTGTLTIGVQHTGSLGVSVQPGGTVNVHITPVVGNSNN